jgi:hypothetical protein
VLLISHFFSYLIGVLCVLLFVFVCAQVSIYPDAVIVLQTDTPRVPTPFRTESQPVPALALSPSRHIVAGVAGVLGGLLGPYERFGGDRIVTDYLWANGHHPFGPFSNATRVSRVMADAALRHDVVGRMDAALRIVGSAMAEIEAMGLRYLSDHGFDFEDVEGGGAGDATGSGCVLVRFFFFLIFFFFFVSVCEFRYVDRSNSHR